MNFLRKIYHLKKLIREKNISELKINGKWENVRIPNDLAAQSALNGAIKQLPLQQFNLSNAKKTFFLFAQPKSASLFITKLFSEVFGAKRYWIGMNEGNGDFYFPRAVGAIYDSGLTISHCHSPARNYIMEFAQNLNIPSIVSYRNLADSLVSRKDMLIKDGWASQLISFEGMKKFINGSKDYQIDVIIDLYACEYLNFYSSWKQNATPKTWFIDYDEFFSDQLGQFEKLANFFELPFSKNNAEGVIKAIQNSGGVNFNKGIRNRGKTDLSPDQKKKLIQLSSMFGITDKRYIGV